MKLADDIYIFQKCRERGAWAGMRAGAGGLRDRLEQVGVVAEVWTLTDGIRGDSRKMMPIYQMIYPGGERVRHLAPSITSTRFDRQGGSSGWPVHFPK